MFLHFCLHALTGNRTRSKTVLQFHLSYLGDVYLKGKVLRQGLMLAITPPGQLLDQRNS